MDSRDNTKIISYLSGKSNNNALSHIVVKRQGLKENFDERKTYGSVYAACTTMGYGAKKRESLAHEIVGRIKDFAKDKLELKSSAIRQQVIAELRKLKEDKVASCYESHCPPK